MLFHACNFLFHFTVTVLFKQLKKNQSKIYCCKLKKNTPKQQKNQTTTNQPNPTKPSLLISIKGSVSFCSQVQRLTNTKDEQRIYFKKTVIVAVLNTIVFNETY